MKERLTARYRRVGVASCLGLLILSPEGIADGLPVGFSLVPVSATGNHTIEGNEIFLLTGGEDVTFEIYLRGWYPNPQDDPYLAACQVTIDSAGFTGGQNGHLELAYTSCLSHSDCPSDEWWTSGECLGVVCNLPSALYVDKLHPDYVFSGVDALWSVFDYYWEWGVASVILDDADAVSDPGVARYVGTLVLRVSPDALGTFTVGFVDDPDYTLLSGRYGVPITVPGLTPGSITVHGDCNENALPDDEEIADGTSTDCNGNGVPDECEPDCNHNGIADPCDIVAQASFDCNNNGIPDECDISAGTSDDCDASSVPDECEYGWLEQAKLTAFDGAAHDSFGRAVALSGDLAVVGSPNDDHGAYDAGSVYVYRFDGVQWVQEAKLTASDAGASDYFGISVAVSGDTIIMGANRDEHARSPPGSAYVFRRVQDVWIEEAKLTASDADGGEHFGRAVAVNGELAAVGASRDHDTGHNSGAVYIFRRDDAGTPGDASDDFWTETQKIIPSDAAPESFFGGSISISPGRMVVGVEGLYDLPEIGRAYVFRLDDNGTLFDHNDDLWVEEGDFTGASLSDGFGSSVSIHGDRVAVGAPLDSELGNAIGSAYIFRRDDAGTPEDPSDDLWEQETKLTPSDTTLGIRFGSSVSIGSEWLAVGARSGHNEVIGAGSAYLFRLSNNGTPGDPVDDVWVEQGEITASDAYADEFDGFGYAASISGDLVLVGSPWDSELDNDAGAAYVFDHLDELPDGDDDWVPDTCDNCDLFNPDQLDCQSNGIGDVCDIDSGTSQDVNADGVPDECEHPVEAPAPHDAPKNRYISFTPGTTYTVALQVTLAASEYFPDDVGLVKWVDVPEEMCLLDECSFVSRLSDTPVFRGWDEPVVHIGDCQIVPAATYEIRATPDGVVLTNLFEVATIHKPGTRHYGDVVGIGTGDLPPEPGFTPPNRVVNVADVQALLLTIQGPSTPSVHTTWVDLHGLGPGTVPNYIINVSDLQRIIFGFEGQTYTETPGQLNPAACP